MANVNAPFGLRPVSDAYGKPYNGAVRAFAVPTSDSTAIFVGDLVTAVTTSQIIDGVAYQNVAQSATGDVFAGVVVGVVPVTQDSLAYRAASTQRILLVCDDPNALFMIQQTTGGTALTANDVGLNANIVVAAGSTITGYSGMTLDNTTEATTNTLDVKIIGILNQADNDIGSAVGTGADASRYLVKLNRHRMANQIAGI